MIENVARFFQPGIEVERWTEIPDAWGGVVQDWAAHLTIEGLIRPLSGDKKLSADKDTAFGTHRLYCFPADITTADRIVWGGVNYAVKFASDVMNFGRFMQVDLEVVD